MTSRDQSTIVELAELRKPDHDKTAKGRIDTGLERVACLTHTHILNSETSRSVDSTDQRVTRRTPRYTSYPTADCFVEPFDECNYKRCLNERSSETAGPLSLYIHVPFCNSLCYYCACNKTVTRQRGKAGKFLKALEKEVDLIVEQLGNSRSVLDLHLGGGTPTWLSNKEIQSLTWILEQRIVFDSSCDRAIEIDPRSIDDQTVECLAELGFNRMSIGVQDLDHRVQRAINRVQPVELTRDVMERARATGFRSVNLDLVYGLPFQTAVGFAKTVDRILELEPERIALFRYAHLPKMFKGQRRIADTSVPDSNVRDIIVDIARNKLLMAGYEPIGLDHYALPHDDLAIAARNGRLQRNFQGYCARKGSDLIAMGPSAISQVGNCFAQNTRGFENWCSSLVNGKLPTERGLLLTRDDHIRRSVINTLMCSGHVDFSTVNTSWLIEFKVYFQKELQYLKKLQAAGLVMLSDQAIEISEKGRRLELQNIASVFDKWFQAS